MDFIRVFGFVFADDLPTDDEKRYYKNFHLDYTGSAVETGKTGMGGAGEAVASTAKKDAFSVECVFLRVRGH